MMVISLDLMIAYHLNLGSTLVCSDLGAIDDNPLVYNDIHLVDQNVLKMTLMMVYMMDNQIVYY